MSSVEPLPRQEPAPGSWGRRLAHPGFAMAYGAVSFGAVSVLAYAIWAYRLVRGEGLMYSAIATVYLGLAGLALSRLVPGVGSWRRFPPLFAGAFLAYALCWCAFWFGLKGRYQADLFGAAVGLAAMAWILHRWLGAPLGWVKSFLVLFALHGVGYYAGEALHASMGGATGRLLWGAAHGMGFGAGLGVVLVRCQKNRNLPQMQPRGRV